MGEEAAAAFTAVLDGINAAVLVIDAKTHIIEQVNHKPSMPSAIPLTTWC